MKNSTMEDAQNISSTTTTTTISDLPHDCLVFIFEQLNYESDRKAFGLTCQKWLEIQNQNRRSLEFDCSSTNFMVPLSGTCHKIDTYKLHRTLARFPYLQSLSLSGCTEIPDSGLTPLQNYGSTLKTLHLDCCFKITDKSLSFISTGCPALKFISLYQCNITDIGLEAMAKGCSNLEVINLSYCSFISDQGILSIIQNCFNLLAIKISNCEGITGVGFHGCSQSLAYIEAESCKLVPAGILGIISGNGLKYLNVSNLGWSIHGDGLHAIGSGFGNRLQVLNMRLCRTSKDECVDVIAKGCPLLVEWNLSLCHEIRVEGWESIALNCHNLEKLHVNRCRNLCDHGLQALGNGCKKLSALYMNGCPRVSAFAFELFVLLRGDVVIKGEESLDLPSDIRAIMCPTYNA